MSSPSSSESTLIVPLRREEGGRLLVGDSRVPLETVVSAFRDGATPEEIVLQFPTLHLGDVYSTVSYYLQNPQEVESYLHRRRLQNEKVREENEKRFPKNDIRARLLRRRTENQNEADWQQIGLASFEMEWDNPSDAIYDNWRELYPPADEEIAD